MGLIMSGIVSKSGPVKIISQFLMLVSKSLMTEFSKDQNA